MKLLNANQEDDSSDSSENTYSEDDRKFDQLYAGKDIKTNSFLTNIKKKGETIEPDFESAIPYMK